jgi:hypothetical protein
MANDGWRMAWRVGVGTRRRGARWEREMCEGPLSPLATPPAIRHLPSPLRNFPLPTHVTIPMFRARCERGLSSVGRAPQWHCGGQGFEPPRLHSSRTAGRTRAQALRSIRATISFCRAASKSEHSAARRSASRQGCCILRALKNTARNSPSTSPRPSFAKSLPPSAPIS